MSDEWADARESNRASAHSLLIDHHYFSATIATNSRSK